MRIEGTIWPVGDNSKLTREAWCEFVKNRPEFRRPPLAERPNPFKPGQMMTIRPRPDVADVMIDERVVGHVAWSQSDEPLIVVEIEPAALSLVHQWAYELGGRFEPDSGDSAPC